MDQVAEPFPVGTRVREYEILEVLEGSQFETLCRARHVLLDEERAIKIIRTQLANDPSYRERFVNEAKAFSKLRHKHLVQLYEFGTIDENTFFMVFELVHGESVYQRIKRLGKIPQQDAIKIIREAAEGLQIAHQHNLVHHNISAGSLVIVTAPDGEEITKVVDFGLAKPTREETTKYKLEETIQAKLEYASPESFITGVGQIDPRGDIYSLAALLYFMVSGTLPFKGASPKEYMEKHLHELPESLDFVHPLLNRLIMKALSKAREDRQRSMTELIQDLNRVPVGSVDQTWNAPTSLIPKKPPGQLEPGEVFARRYQIERKIGEGGMGTVYKATDKILDVAVAVKTINKDITDNERTVQRLKREVILARKVAHPNCCRIYDIGETDGVHYVSMEYLEGRTLAEILQDQGAYSPEVGLPILRQLLSALQEAHRVGIFHRDLKPQNIMVDVNGRAIIMDFGISVSKEVNRLTETGMLVGTPRYMAPEQFGNRNVDHRSDIYSMGIIMFEMFTGRLPFDANTPASVMYAHLHGSFLKPTQLAPTIPIVLEKVIMKAMEKDPQNRYQNISEILKDLIPLEGTVITNVAPMIAPTTITPAKTAEPVKPEAVRPASPVSVEAPEEPTVPGKSVGKKHIGLIIAGALFLVALIALVTTFTKKSEPEKKITATVPETPAPVVKKTPAPIPEKQQQRPAPAVKVQPPVTTPPPPVQAFMRTIRLDSDPEGAEIFLDGKSTGKKTPDSLSLASNSTGSVELRMKGYESARVAINDSSPGSIKSTLKQLIEAEGSVSFDSPGNLKIFNGKTLLMDTSSTKTFKLKPGHYNLTLESGGGMLLKHSEKVEVKSGEDTKIPAPPMGFLTINANPSNCKITIDGKYQDSPPIIDLPIQPGMHHVAVEWPSLNVDDEIAVTIENNKKATLRGYVTNDSYGIVQE